MHEGECLRMSSARGGGRGKRPERAAGILAVLLLLTVLISPLHASAGPRYDKETGTIVLAEPMMAALRGFNPRFKPWALKDYAPTILERFAGDEAPGPPFAVITDANRDGAPDVILDGHDGARSLLLAVVSDRSAYEVVVIEEKAKVDPAVLENEFEGKKEKGLAAYLWPVNDDKETGDRVEVFIRLFPQQTNAAGELVNDGGFVEYSYWKGRFFISGEFVA